MGQDGFMYHGRYFEMVYYTDSIVPSAPLFSVLATVGLESLESHSGQRSLVGWRFVGQSKGISLLPWFIIFIYMVP